MARRRAGNTLPQQASSRAILPQVLPNMIVKREHAKKMLEYFQFIDTHPLWGLKQVDPAYYDKLDSIYHELKTLNKKGKRKSSSISS